MSPVRTQKRNAISRELCAAIPLTVSMRVLGDDSRKTCSRRLTTKNGPRALVAGGTFWTAVWIASFLCLRSFHQQTPSAVWIFHFPHTNGHTFQLVAKTIFAQNRKERFRVAILFRQPFVSVRLPVIGRVSFLFLRRNTLLANALMRGERRGRNLWVLARGAGSAAIKKLPTDLLIRWRRRR